MRNGNDSVNPCIGDALEKAFQMFSFDGGVNAIDKPSKNLLGYSAIDITLFSRACIYISIVIEDNSLSIALPAVCC